MMPGTCVKIKIIDSYGDRHSIGYSRMTFSGGEVHVRLDTDNYGFDTASYVILRADIRSAEDLIELVLVTDALRYDLRQGILIHLVCPYLPYARQDRVCAPGEALSLRVVCDLINAQDYESVQVWDVHSPTALALLNRSIDLPVRNLIPPSIVQNSLLIAPDTGAVKRVEAVAKLYNRPMVVAEKHRDPNDGSISGVRCHIPEALKELDYLIVDDICDGGRTFIELAKVLPLWNADKEVNLWVTHGIFSKGFSELGEWFNNIYTANPFPAELPEFVHNTLKA